MKNNEQGKMPRVMVAIIKGFQLDILWLRGRQRQTRVLMVKLARRQLHSRLEYEKKNQTTVWEETGDFLRGAMAEASNVAR